MAKYETPPPVRPLEKLITVLLHKRTRSRQCIQRFPDLYHPRVFSRCSPTAELEVQTAAEHEIYANAHGWVRLMASRIKDDTSWYDPFGDLYMALVSKSAQQSQGQFFTPVHIATSWCCAPKRKKKRPDRGWVIRPAEAEGCCWPIMHGIRETTP